jgi:hypothetical protein
MVHTPIDFLLSSALLGTTLPAVVGQIFNGPGANNLPTWPCQVAALLWIANQGVRLARLNTSGIFEHRAAAALLNLPKQRTAAIASFLFAALVPAFAMAQVPAFACLAAFGAVLLARYLFFVTVVPLNMALTFTRGGAH